MMDEIVDEVIRGRRLPLSRAFAQAGFSRAESELWRRAGWTDAAEAAPWHRISSDRNPTELRTLFLRGFTPERVVALDRDDETEIDLRDRVLQNLHRDAPQRALEPRAPVD